MDRMTAHEYPGGWICGGRLTASLVPDRLLLSGISRSEDALCNHVYRTGPGETSTATGTSRGGEVIAFHGKRGDGRGTRVIGERHT